VRCWSNGFSSGVGLIALENGVMEVSLLGIPDALTLPADALLDRLGSFISGLLLRRGKVP